MYELIGGMKLYGSFVPNPTPSFCRLQYGKAGRAWYISSNYMVALFPVTRLAFVACSTVKRGGPGTFPHVSDVKGRKT